MTMPSTLSRFEGSMVGAVVGDCIGNVFEDYIVAKIGVELVLKEVEKVNAVAEELKNGIAVETDSDGKKRKNVWKYTDDTAMARSVDKSLITNNGLKVKDVAKRFTEEYFKEEYRGYGRFARSVFEDLKECDYKDLFEPAREQFGGQGSFRNGGAMRIGPAALYAYKKELNFDQLYDLVLKITLITHSHHRGILGAVLQCYAVLLALQTETLDANTFIDQILEKLVPLEKKLIDEHDKSKQKQEGSKTNIVESAADIQIAVGETYACKLEEVREFVSQQQQPTDEQVKQQLGNNIAALCSVPTAVYCFLRAAKPIEGLDEHYNAFERTIIYAISLGGDTDTIATMAGAIAGAYYGLESVPCSWQRCCEGIQEALTDSLRLYNLGCGNPMPDLSNPGEWAVRQVKNVHLLVRGQA